VLVCARGLVSFTIKCSSGIAGIDVYSPLEKENPSEDGLALGADLRVNPRALLQLDDVSLKHSLADVLDIVGRKLCIEVDLPSL